MEVERRCRAPPKRLGAEQRREQLEQLVDAVDRQLGVDRRRRAASNRWTAVSWAMRRGEPACPAGARPTSARRRRGRQRAERGQEASAWRPRGSRTASSPSAGLGASRKPRLLVRVRPRAAPRPTRSGTQTCFTSGRRGPSPGRRHGSLGARRGRRRRAGRRRRRRWWVCRSGSMRPSLPRVGDDGACDRGLRGVHRRPPTAGRPGRRAMRSRRPPSPDSFVWIGLYEPTPEEFEAVRRRAGPPRAGRRGRRRGPPAPEARGLRRRPLRRAEDRAVRRRRRDRASSPRSSCSSGPTYVVSVRHGDGSALAEVRAERWSATPSGMRCGPMAVLHAVIDHVVDDYGPVIDGPRQRHGRGRGRRVRSGPRPRGADPSQRIFKLKREVLDFHRNTEPLLEPLARLVAGNLPVAQPGADAPTSATWRTTSRASSRRSRSSGPAVRRPRRQPRPS